MLSCRSVMKALPDHVLSAPNAPVPLATRLTNKNTHSGYFSLLRFLPLSRFFYRA
jgi:hypothetical protein